MCQLISNQWYFSFSITVYTYHVYQNMHIHNNIFQEQILPINYYVMIDSKYSICLIKGDILGW